MKISTPYIASSLLLPVALVVLLQGDFTASFPTPQYSRRYYTHQKSRWWCDNPLSSSDTPTLSWASKDDNIFFDDFGDNFYDENSNNGNNNLSSLQSRMSEVKMAEQSYDSKIARNWNSGNWGVRGFALDQSSYAPSSTATPEKADVDKPVHVSVVAAPTSSLSYTDISLPQDRALPQDKVAIGRTDGSVFIVKLGDQYLTNFMSVPKLVVQQDENNSGKGDSDMSVRVENKWMNSEDSLQDEADDQTATESPFEITYQFQASEEGEAINKIVFHDDIQDDSSSGIICTTTINSGEISMWKLPSSQNTDIIQTAQLSGVHNAPIIGLEAMVINEKNILFSASRDGTFALWDIENGELITSMSCTDAQNGSTVPLTCASVYNPSSWEDDVYNLNENINDVIFLGTSDGYVLGYVVQEQLGAISFNPGPNIRFRAHGDTGKGEAVTAIKAGGDGTIATSAKLRGGTDESQAGRNPRMSSSILFTGGEDGSVKQWEILSQRTQSSAGIRMEHWPRLSTQRMKRRAHVFSPSHDGPVTCISQQTRHDTSKFLTSGEDGSVCIWSATSGKVLYRMDGFDNLTSLAFIGRELLVTDGMQGMVCVHDFGIPGDAAENGYDLEW